MDDCHASVRRALAGEGCWFGSPNWVFRLCWPLPTRPHPRAAQHARAGKPRPVRPTRGLSSEACWSRCVLRHPSGGMTSSPLSDDVATTPLGVGASVFDGQHLSDRLARQTTEPRSSNRSASQTCHPVSLRTSTAGRWVGAGSGRGTCFPGCAATVGLRESCQTTRQPSGGSPASPLTAVTDKPAWGSRGNLHRHSGHVRGRRFRRGGANRAIAPRDATGAIAPATTFTRALPQPCRDLPAKTAGNAGRSTCGRGQFGRGRPHQRVSV